MLDKLKALINIFSNPVTEFTDRQLATLESFKDKQVAAILRAQRELICKKLAEGYDYISEEGEVKFSLRFHDHLSYHLSTMYTVGTPFPKSYLPILLAADAEPDNIAIEPGKIYFRIKDDQLEYTVIAPPNKKISALLNPKSLNIQLSNPLSIESIQAALPTILQATTKAGHTVKDYSSEPRQVVQIKDLINALYHGEMAFLDLESLNIRGTYHLDLVEKNKKPVPGKIYLRNPLDHFRIAAAPADDNLNADTLYLREEVKEGESIIHYSFLHPMDKKQVVKGSVNADDLKIMFGQEGSIEFLTALKAGEFEKIDAFKKKLGSNLLKAGQLPLVYYVINTLNQKLVVDKVFIDELKKVFTEEEIDRLCFAIEENEVENLSLLKDGIIAIAKERNQTVDVKTQREIDISRLLNSTIEHAYTACYLATHLDLDLVEMFSREFAIGENLLSDIQNYADSPERGMKMLEKASDFARNHAHDAGYVAGVAVAQMQPKDGKVDYDFLSFFCHEFPKYLQSYTQQIKDYTEGLLEKVIEKGVPLDPIAIATLKEHGLDKKAFASLEASAMTMGNSLMLLRDNSLFLPLEVIHYISVLNNIVTISSSILKQALNMNEASQAAVCAQLSKLKYELLPPLFALADKIEDQFLLKPGSLSAPLNTQIKALYDVLIEYTGKYVDFVQQAPALMVLEDSKLLDLRIQETQARIDQAQQKLHNAKDAKVAFLKFYNIISSPQYRGLRIDNLPPSVKEILTTYFSYFKHTVEQYDVSLANAIVCGLYGGEKSQLYMVNEFYEGWWKKYQDVDWIANLLNHAVNLGNLLDREINTQNFHINSNIELVQSIYTNAKLTLSPNDPARQPLTFNEQKVLKISDENAPAYGFDAKDKWGAKVTRLGELNSKQSVALASFYTSTKEQLLSARAAYKSFMLLMDKYPGLPLFRFTEEDKAQLRNWYNIFQPCFCQILSALPNIQFLDKQIIDSLNSKTDTPSDLKLHRINSQLLGMSEPMMNIPFAEAISVCEEREKEYSALARLQRSKEITEEAQFPFVENKQAKTISGAVKLHFENEHNGYKFHLIVPDAIKEILERLKLKTLSTLPLDPQVRSPLENQIVRLFQLDEQLNQHPALDAALKQEYSQLLAKIGNLYLEILAKALAADGPANYDFVRVQLTNLREQLIPRLLSLTDEIELHTKVVQNSFTTPVFNNLCGFHYEITRIVYDKYPALKTTPPLRVVPAPALETRLAPIQKRMEVSHYNSVLLNKAQEAFEAFYQILEEDEFKERRIIDLSPNTKELLKRQFVYFRSHLLDINPDLEASIANGLNSPGRSPFYMLKKHWDYYAYGYQTNDWIVHVLANKEAIGKVLQDQIKQQNDEREANFKLAGKLLQTTTFVLSPVAQVTNPILFNELDVLGFSEQKSPAFEYKKEEYSKRITATRKLSFEQAQQLHSYYAIKSIHIEQAIEAFDQLIDLLEKSPALTLDNLGEEHQSIARQCFYQFQPYLMASIGESASRQVLEKLEADLLENLNSDLSQALGTGPVKNSIEKSFFIDLKTQFKRDLQKIGDICQQREQTYANLSASKLTSALSSKLDLSGGSSAPELQLRNGTTSPTNPLANIAAEPLNYGFAGKEVIYFEASAAGLKYTVVSPSGLTVSDLLTKKDLPDLNTGISENIPFLDFERIKALPIDQARVKEFGACLSDLHKASQEWNNDSIPPALKASGAQLLHKISRQTFYILRELSQNNASNPEFIRHKLLVMREKTIPQLLSVADQMEVEAQLAHGSLTSALEQHLQAMVHNLVEETERHFALTASTPELQGSATALKTRIQPARQRQQLALQNLNKSEQIKAAFESFYNIIEDQQFQGKRLIDLPAETKQQLKEHFVYFRTHVLQLNSDLEEAIVNGLNGESRSRFYGIKTFYDYYVHNYQNMDWITNLIANKELISKAINQPEASQQHIVDTNYALEQEIVKGTDFLLRPVDIKQDLILFNEPEALNLSSKESAALNAKQMDYGVQIAKLEDLSHDQAYALHAYYTLRTYDLHQAGTAYEQFIHLIASTNSEHLSDLPASEKLLARQYYFQFRPFFLAAMAKASPEGLKAAQNSDAAIIANLNSQAGDRVLTDTFLKNKAWFKETLTQLDASCEAKLTHYQELGHKKLKESLASKLNFPAAIRIDELKLTEMPPFTVKSDFAEALASPFRQEELQTLSPLITAVTAARGHTAPRLLPNLNYGSRANHVLKHDHYAQKIGEFRQSLMNLTQSFNLAVRNELHLASQQPNKLPYPELEDPDKVLAQSRQVLAIKQLFNALYHFEHIIGKLQKLDNNSSKLIYVYHLLQAYGHISELYELCKSLTSDPHLSMLTQELLTKAREMKQVVMKESEPYLADASKVDPQEVPGEVRYNAIWYTLQAFFMVPEQIKAALEGDHNLSAEQRQAIQTNTKKVVINIERIISKSDSLRKLLGETFVMYDLFQELRVKLGEFTGITHNFIMDHLEEINTVTFAKILLEVDKWEDKLHLEPGKLSGPMKLILDELYNGMLEPLELRSEQHMKLVFSDSPTAQRLAEANKRLDEAEEQLEPLKEKMKPLASLMGAIDHYLHLNGLRNQVHPEKDQAMKERLDKALNKAGDSVLEAYEKAYPLLEEHHKKLPVSKDISPENKLIDKLIHSSNLKTPVKLANIKARVSSTYSYFQGELASRELTKKTAEEKAAHLEQMQARQAQENQAFREKYTREAFDKHTAFIINRQVGLHTVNKEKLKEHLMSFKEDIVAQALNDNDIQKKIARLLIVKAREFQKENFAYYQQLDKVKTALNAFKNYFDYASDALLNQKSLYESQKTLSAKQLEIEKLETIADDTTIPVKERLETLKSGVESPVFKTIIFARQHLDMFSLAWVKRCFLGLLEALHLYKPGHVKSYDQLHSATHKEFPTPINPNGYGQSPLVKQGLFGRKASVPDVDDLDAEIPPVHPPAV